MKSLLKKLWRHDDAATAVEYAIMLALILMVVLSAVVAVGQKNNQSWSSTKNSLETFNVGGSAS